MVAGSIEVLTHHVTRGAIEPLGVHWAGCPDGPPDAQCADLMVPLDHAKPGGPHISIAVARLPASGRKIGSLVMNPGGPGGSGVEFLMGWANRFPRELRERFDLVSFDPRGVGSSQPSVDCGTDAEDDADRADIDTDFSAAGVARTDNEIEAYAQRCVDAMGEEFLANVGTESVAKDMDLLREALGDDQLTYIGFSYGTYLGEKYAELFPQRVRAMVLDGVVDPQVDPMQSILASGEAFQHAFDDYAAECARAPDCPLGTDPTKAIEKFRALVDPLPAHPGPTDDPRGLGYNDAMTGVYAALFGPDYWDYLTKGLAALRDHKPADELLLLADGFFGRDDAGHYDNNADAFNAVMCADLPYPTDEAAWVALDRTWRQEVPFDSFGEFTGHAPRTARSAGSPLACGVWPIAADDVPRPVSASGVPPTLVVSTTGDPATPYLDGVRVADQMHARLLTVHGTKHTASFEGNKCVDGIVTAYLTDLTLPAPGARCGFPDKTDLPKAEPVQWGPCVGSPEAPVAPAAQCGNVSVPMDYSEPDAARATIAVARLPATGEKIGSLLMNFGGPGYSGVDALMDFADYFPARLRERFDLVGFDPRGIGQSRPAVECNSDAEDDADRADPDVDNSQAGVAETERERRDYMRRCVDKTGVKFLANVGTKSVAKDMDQLRDALGDDKLTYIGFSYGTQLGSEYAQLFPDRVRAMVLDGAVDPTVPALQAELNQAAAFQKAYDVYAADCAKDPNCPLGTDPGKAVEKLHDLVNPLVEHPAPTKDPRGLSYNDAVTAVDSALYGPWYWDQLTAGLTALRDGKPADDLLALADEQYVRDSQGHYDNVMDDFNAVVCADNKYPTDESAWVEFDKQYRAAWPYHVYGEFSGHAPRGVCAFWPFPADVPHPVSAPGLPRVLVISTTGDPATPYLDGVHLAEQMHAALLTVEGTQHTAAFYQIPCVDDIVADYLVDRALPTSEMRCSAR